MKRKMNGPRAVTTELYLPLTLLMTVPSHLLLRQARLQVHRYRLLQGLRVY